MKSSKPHPKTKPKPKSLKRWSELKHERFKKDPVEAIAYLNAAFEENTDSPELIAEAIRSVSQALGMSVDQIAKKARIEPSTVYKALGTSGNPTLATLTAVLKTMGLRLIVQEAD